MRKIIIIILFSLLLFSCDNLQNVEIIKDLDEIYLVSDKVDSKVEVLDDDEKQLNEIMEIIQEKLLSRNCRKRY
ncbi:MAG: hypothetical protein H6612_04355 [Ignavibacteriales bacterium]|nr:hypothetical protein [Ignavibacteriales bacterium]